MRNLSSFIASTAQSEHKGSGAWAAGLFVAALLAGSALAAFWIGNAISTPAAAEAPIVLVDEGFQ